MEKMRLSELQRDKVLLVFGASRGIGSNFVKQYTNKKGTVIIAPLSSIAKHILGIRSRRRLSPFVGR